MRLLKRFVPWLLAVPVVLYLAAFFLPSHYWVERSVFVRAAPDEVFAYLNNVRNWARWTVWTATEPPGTTVSFSGPATGVGGTCSWQGKASGQATLRITGTEPGKAIAYTLDFADGKHRSKGAMVFVPMAGGVKIVWFNEGQVGRQPVARYLGLLAEGVLGKEFEEGLAILKGRIEGPFQMLPPLW